MSPSASDVWRDTERRIVVIGNPESRRVALFQAALARLGLPQARLVAYADLLADRVSLTDVVPAGALVRIESPGKDFAVEQAILMLGADADDPEASAADARYERMSRQAVTELAFDKGRILPSRQWYLGYCTLLGRIESQLREIPGIRIMNTPADIALMFDKRACHAHLAQSGIAIPPAVGPAGSYDELIACMRHAGLTRVFVKIAHGSSASGVVAYRFNGEQQVAITTVEMVRQGGQLLLYNSRRLHTYRDPQAIAALIDALCRQRAHVEVWLPKAGFAGRTCDLRIMVVAGRARHIVARLSASPMTNLHLLNARGDAAAVIARIGEAQWSRAMATCEAALGTLSSLYAGIDLLFTPEFRQHAILEMNAFGDLLPDVLHEGQDTYAAETLAALDGHAPLLASVPRLSEIGAVPAPGYTHGYMAGVATRPGGIGWI